MDKGFNVRVYGICFNGKRELLLVNESYAGKEFTKFPGGGLENGEGILDCLKREFREELNWNIDGLQHFYTTEDYVPCIFDPKEQIISIYYRINEIEGSDMPEHFFWRSLLDLKISDVHLPVDKRVVELIMENC